MGWLRKKGKQIVKGIKSAFKKVKGVFGKVFSKLGVLGQVGMMFLMPYAAGAIGSFFGGAGKLASWSSKLLSKSGIGVKALGHTLNLVNKAGTFAGNVYNTVSNTIGNAVDRVSNFAKGKGFTLSEGRTSIFAKDKVVPTTPEVKLNLETPPTVKDAGQIIDIDALAKDVEIQSQLTKTIPDTLGIESTKQKSLLDFDPTKLDLDVTTEVIKDTTTDKTLLETLKSVPSEIAKGVKEFDVQQAITTGLESSVTGGIQTAGTQAIAKGLGYETPEGPSSYYIDIPELMDAGAMNPSVYNQVDLTAQRQGNNYFTSNIQNSNYLNNLIGEGSDAYNAYMSNFAASQYTPMQRALGMGV